MQNLQEKSLRAIRTLLERKGYEIIDSEWGSEEDKVIGVVAKDDDILVFVDVKEKEFDNDGLDNPDHLSRTELEIEAAKWLSSDFNTVEGDFCIRFDTIDLLIISGNRALVRHQINALGGDNTDVAD